MTRNISVFLDADLFQVLSGFENIIFGCPSTLSNVYEPARRHHITLLSPLWLLGSLDFAFSSVPSAHPDLLFSDLDFVPSPPIYRQSAMVSGVRRTICHIHYFALGSSDMSSISWERAGRSRWITFFYFRIIFTADYAGEPILYWVNQLILDPLAHGMRIFS